MPALTKPVQTGLGVLTNLGALLRALGWTSVTRPSMLLFDNPSGATTIYIHFTSSNLSAGLTGTHGIPLLGAVAPARRSLELLTTSPHGLDVDINHIWIFAAADVPLTVAISGN